MTKLEMILNTISNKDIFEYAFIDKDLNIVNTSLGISKYLEKRPVVGESILIHMPELYECGENIEDIFDKKDKICQFDLIQKNKFYVNVSIDYYNENMALVLLENVTKTTKAKQKILQFSNERELLYQVLQQMIDRQNAYVFLSNEQDMIEFSNKKFMEYLKVKNLDALNNDDFKFYTYNDIPIESYNDLYVHINEVEDKIKINHDIFIAKATSLEAIYKLFTFTKVTGFLEQKHILEKEIYIDSLTQVYRKTFFDVVIKKLFDEGAKFSLVVVDIDNFKYVNDEYGHQVGDIVLQEFTALIKDFLYPNEMIARWGGDEFLLMIRDVNKKRLKIKIKRIRQCIKSYTFSQVKNVTASFGVARVNKKDNRDSLLYRADKALRKAKMKGKNKVVFKKYKE